MQSSEFLDRVFARLATPGNRFRFESWSVPGRPTAEGLGVLPVAVDVDAMVARILDVDHYCGNIDHVAESRSLPDPQLSLPEGVRFYQRLKIPMVAELQFVNAMRDYGERDGWRVIGWSLLKEPTEALNTRQGARFDYNDGAWLLRPDGIGYALASAPRKKDVGRIKFAVMTKGADATAPLLLENNIKGMLRWSAR
ncbi:MAG: hypothetical protein ACI9WU_003886 [Myxococcota bacterium]|jgi:hypothetical protein